MALAIDTFSNRTGGFSFFKAAGHPAVASAGRALLARLAAAGPVAIYDPLGFAQPFAELYDFTDVEITDVFVQDIAQIGETVLGHAARPVSDFPSSPATTLFVVAFDAAAIIRQIHHLVAPDHNVVSLDEMRLDDARLTNPAHYLDPLNFATNYAFFREINTGTRHHTRLATANYWHRHGARGIRLWLLLLDGDGAIVADWEEALPDAPAAIAVDSRAVKARFSLADFTGQLFVHAIGVKGHDIVKYALDTYGESGEVLSCTHDANAWPADFYAGLPAPDAGEHVIVWVQNSHPCPIPAGAVALNPMGRDAAAVTLDRAVPAFGTVTLDAGALLPDLAWPQQIELRAGKHMVRPRYEVVAAANGGPARQRIAHVNVERTDLEPDPRIAELSAHMGKGYILPAPVLSRPRFRSLALPTPMATTQTHLPLTVLVYDPDGGEVARAALGELARSDSVAVDLDDVLGEHALDDYGHMELVYDFSAGGTAAQRGVDGWLHALFRYEDRDTGHAAETSFGAHIFNTVLVWQGEPQSYGGPPPGLSTRLFLRCAPDLGLGANGAGGADTTMGAETVCQLIYPASTPWHATSDTQLVLHDSAGTEVATASLAIPCGGSRRIRLSEVFDTDARRATANGAVDGGTGGYVVVRDTTCRLFGYHGLVAHDGTAFSLDHMFGF